MGELKKLSLISETKREAREIEKELEANPELDDIVVTEEMDAALFARIKALEENRENYDTEDDEEPPKKTIPYRRKKRRRYLIVGIAAVLVLVMGTGLVGVGNKGYWKEVLEKEYVGEDQRVIKVEDMDDIESVDGGNFSIFGVIEEELGLDVVRIRYTPKSLKYLQYEISENLQQARVFYECDEQIIRYTIYLNSTDSSWAEKIEDEKVGEYTIVAENINRELIVEEYKVPEYEKYRLVANFEYLGVQYQLKGIMDKDEFDDILKNLFYTEINS